VYLAFDARRYEAMKRLARNIGRRTQTYVEAGGLVVISQRALECRMAIMHHASWAMQMRAHQQTSRNLGRDRNG
jgi:hypothetical protein